MSVTNTPGYDLREWEIHVPGEPCPACRYVLKGYELWATRLWCPECKHFHRGPCPEIQQPEEKPE